MADRERAQAIAADAGLALQQTPAGLALSDGTMQLVADFRDAQRRARPDALARELLVRAARVRGVEHPRALDATAGLGEDAFLLAAAGFDVELYEADPVIAALLRDALGRAAAGPDAALATIVGRMRLVEGDSVAALSRIAQGEGARPDVVYLDPMFPGRRKSAAVKKKFQLLHRLERPCADERALLDAALAVRPRKVVVKRPVKGPHLAGAKPDYTLCGKAVRYDCFAFADAPR